MGGVQKLRGREIKSSVQNDGSGKHGLDKGRPQPLR